MNKPVAIFTSIAAIAAAALGVTLYVNKAPEVVQQVATSTAAPAAPAEQKTAEPTPATPTAEAPAQQQAAAEPAASAAAAPAAPAVETPAAAEAEASATPASETPPAPAAAAPAAETPAAPAATTEVAVATPQPEAAPSAPAAPALPSFDTVRVETTGDAVIAGRAEPDSDVTVKWNGNVVGTTKANVDGSFVLVPANPLKTGIGAMTVEMAKNGAVTVSDGSVFVVVKKDAPAMVAKVDPVAPTEVVQSGAPADLPKDLQLTAVDYDAVGNIVFSGKAVPDTVVRFYVDNVATGEGKADATGAWRFVGNSAVTPGTHSLRADAVDAEGKVQSRIELPFLREDAATVAAAQVAAAEPAAQPASRSVLIEPAPAPVPAAEAAAPAVESSPAAPAADAPEASQHAAETQVAATPEQPAAPAVEEGPRKLVIQPGNNLWKLSREVYGKGRMYTIIFEANRDLVKNPNKIYPGQILTAPKQP